MSEVLIDSVVSCVGSAEKRHDGVRHCLLVAGANATAIEVHPVKISAWSFMVADPVFRFCEFVPPQRENEMLTLNADVDWPHAKSIFCDEVLPTFI